MLKTASLLDRANYEVINFAVKAEDINIDKTKQAVQTATGIELQAHLSSNVDTKSVKQQVKSHHWDHLWQHPAVVWTVPKVVSY